MNKQEIILQYKDTEYNEEENFLLFDQIIGKEIFDCSKIRIPTKSFSGNEANSLEKEKFYRLTVDNGGFEWVDEWKNILGGSVKINDEPGLGDYKLKEVSEAEARKNYTLKLLKADDDSKFEPKVKFEIVEGFSDRIGEVFFAFKTVLPNDYHLYEGELYETPGLSTSYSLRSPRYKSEENPDGEVILGSSSLINLRKKNSPIIASETQKELWEIFHRDLLKDQKIADLEKALISQKRNSPSKTEIEAAQQLFDQTRLELMEAKKTISELRQELDQAKLTEYEQEFLNNLIPYNLTIGLIEETSFEKFDTKILQEKSQAIYDLAEKATGNDWENYQGEKKWIKQGKNLQKAFPHLRSHNVYRIGGHFRDLGKFQAILEKEQQKFKKLEQEREREREREHFNF